MNDESSWSVLLCYKNTDMLCYGGVVLRSVSKPLQFKNILVCEETNFVLWWILNIAAPCEKSELILKSHVLLIALWFQAQKHLFHAVPLAK